MTFIYRNFGNLIYSFIIYAIVAIICIWVMTNMVKKYIDNRKRIGKMKAFKQSWYHFFPLFVLFVMTTSVFIYGTLTEAGGYYKVENNSVKLKYFLGRFGKNQDIKISEIKNIDLYKQISDNKMGYSKIKEAMKKRKVYKDIGLGGYDVAYFRLKNGKSAYILTRLTNKQGQTLEQYLIKKYKVSYKIKDPKQLNEDKEINSIK